MKNSELCTAPAHLMTSIEKQRRFLVKTLSVAKPCPNCGFHHSFFEAAGVAMDNYDFTTTSSADQKFRCRHCNRELLYHLPWPTGEWYFGLVHIKPDAPRTPLDPRQCRTIDQAKIDRGQDMLSDKPIMPREVTQADIDRDFPGYGVQPEPAAAKLVSEVAALLDEHGDEAFDPSR